MDNIAYFKLTTLPLFILAIVTPIYASQVKNRPLESFVCVMNIVNQLQKLVDQQMKMKTLAATVQSLPAQYVQLSMDYLSEHWVVSLLDGREQHQTW